MRPGQFLPHDVWPLAAAPGRFARVAPALPWLGLLAVVVASVASAAYLRIAAVPVDVFIARNEIGASDRSALMYWTLAPFLLASVGAVALWLMSSPAVWVGRLERGVRLVAPLALTTPTLMLSAHAFWADHQFEFLLLLAVVTLVGERLARLTFTALPSFLAPFAPSLAKLQARREVRALPLVLVIGGAAAFALFLGYYSIQQHHRILTGGFDLGHYEILMFNAMHGNFFRSPILWAADGGNNLANHAELIMLLFVPFYAIRPSAEAMLVIQAVVMGSSVIPLFLFARSVLTPWTALAISFSFLVASTLASPLFYDFHWLPFAIPFTFLLMYALSARRWKLAAVALLLSLLVREDVAFTLAIASTWFITSRRNVALGIALSTICLAWFVGMKFGLMRWAGSFDFGWIYDDLIVKGEKGVGSVVKTAVTNPLFLLESFFTKPKLLFMLHLLVPLAFLPWRNWKWVLMSSGAAVMTVMTTNTNDAFISIHFHYLMHWTPVLFAGTILALRALGRSGPDGIALRRSALSAMVFASVLHSLTFGAVFDRSHFVGGFQRIPFQIIDSEVQRAELFAEVKALIPPDASVCATDLEVAQLCTRETAYSLKITTGSADFIVMDRNHMDKDQRDRLGKLFTTEKYGVVFDRSPYVVFKRGVQAATSAGVSRSLGVDFTEFP